MRTCLFAYVRARVPGTLVLFIRLSTGSVTLTHEPALLYVMYISQLGTQAQFDTIIIQNQGRIESPRTRGHATRDHQKLYEYIHFP